MTVPNDAAREDDDRAGELELGGGEGAAAGGGVGVGRVKGPWSPEEDVVLGRLVGKFGARNWSLIARGIPGRSGKSCRLRWCNQLDPGVMRKPFSGKLTAIAALTQLPFLVFVWDFESRSDAGFAFFFVGFVVLRRF